MRRRGFAVLLSLVMLLAVLPAWTMAADTQLYGEKGDAVITVNAGKESAAEVSAAELEAAVDRALSADENQSPAVEIQVALSAEPTRMEITLPVETLETLGSHKGAVLTITSALAGVALDDDAMDAIVNQAAGKTATLTVVSVFPGELTERQRQIVNGAPVYELALVSGGKEINTFGGGAVTVELPYKLPAGQKAAGVVVWSMDEYNRLTDCDTSYDTYTGAVTFTTRHFSLYVIGYEEPKDLPFTDVSGNYWAYTEIAWAYGKGLVTGKTDTTFQPDGTMTRQQVWMILARLSGADPANMAEAKTWAVRNGISDGSAPGAAVTRQQLVTLLYRYAGNMGYSVAGKASLGNYPDAGSISAYAAESMAWAVGNNVISGTVEGYLNPGVTATRAHFAVILWRFWGIIV